MVRPLKYLLDKKYELTPDLDLQNLPLEAIQSVSKKISTKLQAAGINSIPELANASTELKVKEVSKKEIKKAISYAQDIMTHASEPGIQEGVMPLEELLDKKYEMTNVADLTDLDLEAIQGITKTDATKIRKASVALTLQELAGANIDDLRSAGLTDYKANKFLDFANMIMTYAKGEPVPTEPVTEEPVPAEPITEEPVPAEPITTVKKKNLRNTAILVSIPIVIIAILVFLLVFII